MRFTLVSLVVVRHLQSRPSEAALDVETFVGVAAVENALVAADLFGDVVESLDESEAKLLALLVFGNGDIFNVPDCTETVNAALKVSGPSSQVVELKLHWRARKASRMDTYNLRSTIRAPVATTEFSFSALLVSSMTMM